MRTFSLLVKALGDGPRGGLVPGSTLSWHCHSVDGTAESIHSVFAARIPEVTREGDARQSGTTSRRMVGPPQGGRLPADMGGFGRGIAGGGLQATGAR
jgi:hypothetical protein